MSALDVLLVISVVLIFLYYYGTRNYNYWKERGVPYIKAKYPFLGTFISTKLGFLPNFEAQSRTYNAYPEARFVGSFNLWRPRLLVRDPDLIESITVKDFSHFYNRYIRVDTDKEPLSAHLVNLRDEKWKNLRNRLTPTFSSGKLKGMFSQLTECSDEFVNCLSNFGDGTPFEIRDAAARFTTDVISSCAFGINADSMKNPNSQIRQIGLKAFQLSRGNVIRRVIREESGWLLRLLSWKSAVSWMEPFLRNLIRDTLEYRERNDIRRPDFLHLLNELRKKDLQLVKDGQLNEDSPFLFDEQLLVANSFVFLVAGFETTASTIGYALYELALNPNVQEKAHNEVKTVITKHGGQITYDAIKDMTYLAQIVNETLRLHSPASATSRMVTKEYLIPDTKIVLPKGLEVQVPIHSLHHDPKYYPNPWKFDPERFSPENKEKIRKGTFLPFGYGPRICIGMKFAELEVRVALAKVLLNCKIIKCEKTKVPLSFDPRGLLLTPEGGIWLAAEKRNCAK